MGSSGHQAEGEQTTDKANCTLGYIRRVVASRSSEIISPYYQQGGGGLAGHPSWAVARQMRWRIRWDMTTTEPTWEQLKER